MEEYLLFEGNCILYDFKMIPLSSNQENPNWNPISSQGNVMNLIIQLNFNGEPFNYNGILAGFVNDQLVGVVNSMNFGNATYYFLTLSDVGNYPIQFKFYDSENMYTYNIDSNIPFVAGGSAGTVNSPLILDISPIQILLIVRFS